MSALDRTAFMDALHEIEDADGLFDVDDLYQAVLALARPADGIVLTGEEVRLVDSLAIGALCSEDVDPEAIDAIHALRNRLGVPPEDDKEDVPE